LPFESPKMFALVARRRYRPSGEIRCRELLRGLVLLFETSVVLSVRSRKSPCDETETLIW